MLQSMDPNVREGQPWERAALTWFTDRLDDTERFAAFVVDTPGKPAVACAVGTIDRQAPSSRNPTGLHGHISTVSTEPSHRGNGYARTVLTALLDWFDTDAHVPIIDMNATTDGIHLYRLFGFTEPRDLALRRRRPK
jgi:GNAT superfamily N-acetyltransferase